MLEFLEKAKNFYSWVNFGNFVLLITAKTICEILLVVGGISYMPWYSNIGLVIAGIGALGLVYDFYQNYKKRTIPIMEAVYLVESYLKRKNAKIRYDMADVVFWDSKSIYSGDLKGIMLLIFKACKEDNLALFGKQGALPERKIEPFEIDKPELRLRNGDKSFKSLVISGC